MTFAVRCTRVIQGLIDTVGGVGVRNELAVVLWSELDFFRINRISYVTKIVIDFFNISYFLIFLLLLYIAVTSRSPCFANPIANAFSSCVASESLSSLV